MCCKYGRPECTGCGDCRPEPKPYICPICGKEPTDVYKDKYGEIFGCDHCIKKIEAWRLVVEE